MANIGAPNTNNIMNALIWTDRVCDYVPVVSTITNLVDIFEKCVLSNHFSPRSINANRYFSHIRNKEDLRCYILLVPILGNIIIGIFDIYAKNQYQKSTSMVFWCLDREITQLNKVSKNFKEVLNNPDTPLLGHLAKNQTHQENIDWCWSWVQTALSSIGLGDLVLTLAEGADVQEKIKQKQEERSTFVQELLDLRKDSYHQYIQTLSEESLLKEAQKYYLKCFLSEDQKKIKPSLEQMTLETIQPKLQEQLLAKNNRDYDLIEIKEIIARIDTLLSK